MTNSPCSRVLVANRPMIIDDIGIVLIMPRKLPASPVILFEDVVQGQFSYWFSCSDGKLEGNKLNVIPQFHPQTLINALIPIKDGKVVETQ